MAVQTTFLNGNIKIQTGPLFNSKQQAISENYLIEIKNTDIVKGSVTLEYMLTHLCMYEINGLCKINWEGLIQNFRKSTIEVVPKLTKEVAKSLKTAEILEPYICESICKSNNVALFSHTPACKELLNTNPIKE